MMKEQIEGQNVAIVGNSKSLYSTRSGRLIDSHDVVCRMNKSWMSVPPFTGKFARHIGSRTDFLFVNMIRTCGLSVEKQKRVSYKLIQTSPFGYDDPNVAGRCEYIISREEFDELDKKMTNKPSTGLRVLHLISLMNPASVTVFGFDWKKKSPSYWGTRDDWSQENHDFDEEMLYCKNHFIRECGFEFIGATAA